MILDKVENQKDVKSLSIEEMEALAQESRKLIIDKVNTISGHMGPNLGMVEMTIALHNVFNSPTDKFIFDVSHQCYTHKIITGRKDGYLNPENYFKYTGYTAPEECKDDLFKVGHTSTSVSLACGVAKARDLKGEKYNVIAIIGDGSLSGGEALEGLNNAAVLNSNIIIIINDNEMSIAENHGGLYDNLKTLRDTNGQAECNLFKALGFEYLYLEEGNNVERLIETFKKVKDTNCPTVVHIHTLKGKGLELAEKNKEFGHYMMPNTAYIDIKTLKNPDDDFQAVTLDFIREKVKTDKNAIVVNAGTPGVFRFSKDIREEFGKQYTDVGIAEEHAVAYSSALAKSGAKPILNVMSSFIQRTYDQLSQDLCLNNSPLMILIYWGGISGADATHLCTFDISMMSNIPNLVYLEPTTKEEHIAMMEYAYNQNEHPVAIRVPSCELVSDGIKDDTDYSILNKYKVTQKGQKVSIIGLGSFYHLGVEVAKYLKQELNIDATLINPRFITGVDKELLDSLKSNHDIVITLENGELNGGFGEKITRFYGNSDMKVLNYGSFKEFTDRVPLDVLFERYRLKKELIKQDVERLIK